MSYFKRLSALLLGVLICVGAASCSRGSVRENSADTDTGSASASAEVSRFASGAAPVSGSEDASGGGFEESAASGEGAFSAEPVSDDMSSGDTSAEESSSPEPVDEPSAEVSSAEEPSGDTSGDAPPVPTKNRFTPYSPPADYAKVWESGGMELYNTDFRMSDALLKKFGARFSSFANKQSVVLIELDTNMAFCYSKDTKLGTASSIKGPMGLFAYKCIDDGLIGWDSCKAYQPRHFQENSTGLVQNSPFGTVFSVKTLMDYMIRISDNQAYLMMKELVGAEGFEEMMRSLGSTRIIPPGSNWGYITGWEMASVWREIYYYSKSCDSGAELFDRFMHAQYNYIWRAIPQYEAAHKSGWSGKAFNDAGVVFADGHQYVIVVLMGRNDVEDKMAQFQFVYVTRLLADLMVEYNAYLEQGVNPGVSQDASASVSEHTVQSTAESTVESGAEFGAE